MSLPAIGSDALQVSTVQVTIRYRDGRVEAVEDVDAIQDGRAGLTFIHGSGVFHVRSQDVLGLEVGMQRIRSKPPELVEVQPYLRPVSRY